MSNCRIGFGFSVKEVWEIKLTERYYDKTGNETSDIKQTKIPCVAHKKLVSMWLVSGDCQEIGLSDNVTTDDYNYPTG